MQEISASRKDLTFTSWENDALDLTAEHKTQHISELQLLHVTREIQEFMADPERALAYNAEAQLQGQITAIEKARRLKTALFSKRLGQMTEGSEEQSLENQYLRENTAKASMALEERTRMGLALESTDSNPARERARAFRNIVTNQKLLDISKSQMAEIEFLRAEVARLTARSYPSFATPPRPKTSSPDARPENLRHFGVRSIPSGSVRPPSRGATAPVGATRRPGGPLGGGSKLREPPGDIKRSALSTPLAAPRPLSIDGSPRRLTGQTS